MSEQGIYLQPIAGAEDGCLQHLVVGPQLLQRSLHGLFRDAEALPDLHWSRAMTEADDGNVHGGWLGCSDCGGRQFSAMLWAPSFM